MRVDSAVFQPEPVVGQALFLHQFLFEPVPFDLRLRGQDFGTILGRVRKEGACLGGKAGFRRSLKRSQRLVGPAVEQRVQLGFERVLLSLTLCRAASS